MPTSTGPGVPGSRTSNPDLKTLEMLIQEHLDDLARQIPSTMSLDPRGPRQEFTLHHDMGEFLRTSAQKWAEVTETLVKCKQLNQAANSLASDSFRKTRIADINVVTVKMDLDNEKLNRIRDLTNRFSQDVQEVWESPSRPGNSPRTG